MIVLGAFVAGALVAALAWRALAPTFAQPLFSRVNVRGRPVPTAVGVLVVLAALAVEAVLTLAEEAGVDPDAGGVAARRLTVLAAVGLGLLGLLDDVAGAADDRRGFRGHLGALAEGRLTTGAVKLAGGAAVAVVVVAPLRGRSLGGLLVDAALVALAANLGNLLDRAPGRTTKAALVAFAAVLLAAGAEPELAGVAAVVGAAAGLLVPDLRERLMLGDAGANVLGGVLGLAVAVVGGPVARGVTLAVVAALNLASERISFSRVIATTPPLRWLDQLGRRP